MSNYNMTAKEIKMRESEYKNSIIYREMLRKIELWNYGFTRRIQKVTMKKVAIKQSEVGYITVYENLQLRIEL